jgi:hypothetical protein
LGPTGLIPTQVTTPWDLATVEQDRDTVDREPMALVPDPAMLGCDPMTLERDREALGYDPMTLELDRGWLERDRDLLEHDPPML